MKYDFGRGTYLSMNYTFVNDLSVNYIYANEYFSNPDTIFWMSPKQLGTFTANIRLNKYLNLNACLLYRGGWSRNRSEGDLRDDPGDYAIVNATLIARNFLKDLKGPEARAAVKNLFNKEYTSPTENYGWLPDDLPMPGINFFFELRYAF